MPRSDRTALHRRRVAYKVAGAAQRAAIARAASAFTAGRITGLDVMVLHAVFDRTTTFSKLTDRTSARQLAALVYARPVDGDGAVTGGQRRRVRDSLARLAEADVIEFEGALGGQNAGVVVSVPAAPANPHVSPPEHVSQWEHVGGSNVSSPEHPTCSDHDTQRVPTARQHLEVPEKSTEEREPDPALVLQRSLVGPGRPLSECQARCREAQRAFSLSDEQLVEFIEREGPFTEPSDFAKAMKAAAPRLPRGAEVTARIVRRIESEKASAAIDVGGRTIVGDERPALLATTTDDDWCECDPIHRRSACPELLAMHERARLAAAEAIDA